MADDLARSLAFTLRWEGGKVDDPHDRGGRTNRGITQRTYDGWRADQGLPKRDVYDLEEDELQAIYRNLYWWPAKDLPWPLCLVVFDTAVLFGAGRAGGWLTAVGWRDAAPRRRRGRSSASGGSGTGSGSPRTRPRPGSGRAG